jgi:ABC-type lipoprotein release transport system permease subunit
VPYYEDIPIKYVKVRLTDPSQSLAVSQALEKQISSKTTDKVW